MCSLLYIYSTRIAYLWLGIYYAYNCCCLVAKSSLLHLCAVLLNQLQAVRCSFPSLSLPKKSNKKSKRNVGKSMKENRTQTGWQKWQIMAPQRCAIKAHLLKLNIYYSCRCHLPIAFSFSSSRWSSLSSDFSPHFLCKPFDFPPSGS